MVKSLKQSDLVVEAICAEGCRFVNRLLRSNDIQAQHDLLQSLDKEQQQQVITELHSIMNVYSNSGSCTL